MISVIIPMYNASKYIRKTISSILEQDYKDFEVLLVDDGSTDNTKDICIEFENLDNRCKYLYKTNSGVSATRNYGIEHANGEYIIFIDSDDYFIDNELFTKCMDVVNRNPLIMPIYNFIGLKDDGRQIKQFENVISNPTVEDIMANCIAGIKHSTNLHYMFRAVWGKMFNKNIINEYNIRFDESMYMGEDAVFLIEYVKHIETIEDIKSYALMYRTHDDSASRKYKTDLMIQSKKEIKHFEDILLDYDSTLLTSALNEYIWTIYKQMYVNELIGNVNKHIEGKEWLKYNRSHLKDKIDWSKMGKSTRIYIYIYKFLPFMLPLLTRMHLGRRVE